MDRLFHLRRPAVETRGEDGPDRLVGYGAVFYRGTDETEYRIFDDLVERVAPTAFSQTLSDDVMGLFNHDASQPLGRTSAGTMRLSVDEVGLRYEIDLPETTLAKDLRELVKRGDVSGSSFGFRARGVDWEREDGADVRVLKDVELIDTGPVTLPAYKGTSVDARNGDFATEAIQERDAYREHLKREQEKVVLVPSEDYSRRIRLVEIGLSIG